MSQLSDRLRGILRPPAAGQGRLVDTSSLRESGDVAQGCDVAQPPSQGFGEPRRSSPDRPASGGGGFGPARCGSNYLSDVLGGEWREHASGSCFVIERRADPTVACGREPIGSIATRLDGAAADAALLAAGPARPPFVFFDLETTGLSGGAGTFAFLVGCGWFDTERGFVTRQYLLARFADERPMLAAIAGELARAGAIVSFNGKSFDAPVLETRYLFHRLEWTAGRLPHLDILHPARRFWGARHTSEVARGPQPGETSSCSLAALERQILGARRVGDVAGFEIPERYFQFVRTGDAGPLAAVIEHNRLDLLSLAGLTARLLHLVRSGPAEAGDGREALALGRVYAQSGFVDRARAACQHAVERCQSPLGAYDPVRIEGLRSLALLSRRARSYDEAADCWRRLLEVRGCPGHVAREATQALAIHHEHRVRDLAAAKAFALQSLDHSTRPAWNDAVRYRVARIERKLERSNGASLWNAFEATLLD